jgi:hypothetical protein
MSNSHGDLFGEIGKLVLAANSGQAIDLRATAKDLAERYQNLNVSEETIATTVARSIGAIGFSIARVAGNGQQAAYPQVAVKESEPGDPVMEAVEPMPAPTPMVAAKAVAGTKGRKMKSLFPSGVRLALLS